MIVRSKDKKPYDNKLEYHAHQTSEIYDVLLSGMGARPQPLMLNITTAGQIQGRLIEKSIK